LDKLLGCVCIGGNYSTVRCSRVSTGLETHGCAEAGAKRTPKARLRPRRRGRPAVGFSVRDNEVCWNETQRVRNPVVSENSGDTFA